MPWWNKKEYEIVGIKTVKMHDLVFGEQSAVITLFESYCGSRYVDIDRSNSYITYGDIRGSLYYMQVINPWIKGASFDDILSYADVSKKSKEFIVDKLYKQLMRK